jgi:hypothetical protein
MHSLLHSFHRLRFLEGFDPTLLEQYVLQGFDRGLMLDRLEQLTYLLWSFSYANRMLIPTITGTQYPEHSITAVITGFIDTIAKHRIRQQAY